MLIFHVGISTVQERMSEMQSDTAAVAVDTQSNDDTDQSVTDDDPVSAGQHQETSSGVEAGSGTGSVGDVMSETTTDADADADADDHKAGSDDVVDMADDAGATSDDSSTQQLPTSTNVDTDEVQSPVIVSSTDATVTSATVDDDADDDNDVSSSLPTPASAPSSSSASVSIRVISS